MPKADGRLGQLQQDLATRQRDNIATGGEVYCALSCAMTYIDAENGSGTEDTFSRVEKLGGDQPMVIDFSDKNNKPPAVTASG